MRFIADKQTRSDLNILGKYKSSSIFKLFSHTKSIGAEKLLENIFHNPLTDVKEINERRNTIKAFMSEKLDFPFTQDDLDRVETYLSDAHSISPTRIYLNLYTLKGRQLMLADRALEDKKKNILHIVSFLQQMKPLIDKIAKYDNLTPTLVEMIKSAKVVTNSSDISTFLANNRYSDLIKNIEDEVYIHQEISKMKLLDLGHIDYFLRSKYKTQLDDLLQTCYLVDLYSTVANIATERKFTFANAFVSEKKGVFFDAKGLYHPQVKNAVANDVCIGEDANVMFLTGANMAGKSTFMKSVGIAVYLAHLGFPIAAESMNFSVLDGICTSINVHDNLNSGYSHYYAEVKRVKDVSDMISQGKKLMVIFDELFKGTNVKDAHEATREVTYALAQYPTCMYILSTHIVEAAADLEPLCSNLNLVYLPTIMQGNIPTYTYKLEKGISADRHGMMIVTNEKIVEIISGSI